MKQAPVDNINVFQKKLFYCTVKVNLPLSYNTTGWKGSQSLHGLGFY